MRIKLEQLPQHLKNHAAPLYTLFGNEPLLILEAADLIRNHAREHGFTERALFSVDQHFDWSELLNAGNNQSLFADRKIIDIRIPSGKPGKEGGKAIDGYCRALPPDTLTLVTLPRIDKQGQAAKWFKALDEAGVMIPVYAIERDQLPAWIEQRLARQQQKADSASLQFIADQVEGNLLAAHQEIQKLALLYPNGALTFDQIKNVVLNVARYDVFQLSDAMMAADTARYVRVLTGLQGEGVAPLLILATLAEQIRQLIAIRTGLDHGQPPAQLLQSARIWGDRQKIALAAARRIGIPSLTQGLAQAALIDRMIKGVAQGDVWDALLQLGLRFTLPSSAAPVSMITPTRSAATL
ncbi:DNA polymerase III subunit delta [Nitrosomonas sp. JL21]|uniref:DNA polymerase III subunit delta n=1 Tax=Nitrosomonas sp. JL21 TaxID=153949 RepID=UPI0013702A27|nr:DNA polymerase III subunit delta [Nitrosomonas sp. JL21]MBL8498328.1 DNA polymerase III subunit delta [Nitrosomonas sp.]MCC7090455.1 DNA polymerase III subunit delta [Nitrosomonas sp.]MXS77544.1 DNA polymerase III subunit delta [Nitrosomonas sp. JL21]